MVNSIIKLVLAFHLDLVIVSQSRQADMTGLVELSPTSNACHTVLPC